MPFMCRGFTFWLKCKVSTTFFSNALQSLGSFINFLMLKCYSFKSKGFTAVSWPNTNLALGKFCPAPLEFLSDTMGFLVPPAAAWCSPLQLTAGCSPGVLAIPHSSVNLQHSCGNVHVSLQKIQLLKGCLEVREI